jgi:hypothetical protein
MGIDDEDVPHCRLRAHELYLLVPPLGDHGPNLTAPLYEWFHEDPLKHDLKLM